MFVGKFQIVDCESWYVGSWPENWLAGRQREQVETVRGGRWPGFCVHTILEYLRPLGIQYSLSAAPYSQEDDTNVLCMCMCVCLLYKTNPGHAYSYTALSLQLDPQKISLFPTCQFAIQSYCTLQRDPGRSRQTPSSKISQSTCHTLSGQRYGRKVLRVLRYLRYGDFCNRRRLKT
jgi:hypothetical protein